MEYNPIKESNSWEKINWPNFANLSKNEMNLKDIVKCIVFNEYDEWSWSEGEFLIWLIGLSKSNSCRSNFYTIELFGESSNF